VQQRWVFDGGNTAEAADRTGKLRWMTEPAAARVRKTGFARWTGAGDRFPAIVLRAAATVGAGDRDRLGLAGVLLPIVRLRPPQAASALGRIGQISARRHRVVGDRLVRPTQAEAGGGPAHQAGENGATGTKDTGQRIESFALHGTTTSSIDAGLAPFSWPAGAPSGHARWLCSRRPVGYQR
jgi:hypothetical protein